MTIKKIALRVGALAALVALQACSSTNPPLSAYDYENTYKLGEVYDCENVARPDMRTNGDNLPSPGFGCATQSNITLMVANPDDLFEPRASTPTDPRRLQRVYEAYGEGTDTTASRRAEGTQQLIE